MSNPENVGKKAQEMVEKGVVGSLFEAYARLAEEIYGQSTGSVSFELPNFKEMFDEDDEEIEPTPEQLAEQEKIRKLAEKAYAETSGSFSFEEMFDEDDDV